jgi:hypothetical protein
MIYAQGMAEYASILAGISGGIHEAVSNLTNLDVSWSFIAIAAVLGFLFWLIVFKM